MAAVFDASAAMLAASRPHVCVVEHTALNSVSLGDMRGYVSGPEACSLCRNAHPRGGDAGSLAFDETNHRKDQSVDLEVVIEGVADRVVADGITREVRQVCKDNERPGRWSLTVRPSETRGQWDLGVRGPFGQHFSSFTDHVDQLPRFVAATLRGCL